MLGAIIGDIVGSRFEWNNNRSKEFDFLTYKCFPTDDSIMSLALAQAILVSKPDYRDLSKNAVQCMQAVGRQYPDCGYGGSFRHWMFSDDPKPYNSYGNGAAMRVSAAGFAANSLDEVKLISRKITEVTHNHPEGIKGAEATAVAIYLAKAGKSMLEIRDYIDENYYPMNFTLDQIRPTYQFNETCQETVPQAMMAFFESTGFEDAIRNAISIGGDSDTIAAICGGIAEAYYGIPADIRKHALTFLDKQLLAVLVAFENKYPPVMEKKVGDISVAVGRRPERQVSGDDRETMMEAATEAADEDMLDAEDSPEETTSKQLFNHLFEACNILRGPINQDEYKSYVTPILFFKRISDVHDEEYDKALRSSGGDAEFAQFPENFSFIIPDGCHWTDVRNTSTNVGKAIVDAMYGIERANPETLAGVFSSFDDANWTDKNKLSDARLKDLIEHMSKLRVGNENYSADVMGDAYEFLIKRFADLSKKNAGEFYTPRPIVKLMVKILSPVPGETVYDPACGTGGMLIEAIHYMHDDKQSLGRIYGQEKNLSTSSIARMNLFLHGARDFKVIQGDTLRNPRFMEKGRLKKFNCVIANPPFSLKRWGATAFESDIFGRNIFGTPSDSCADYAWIQHMLSSMDKNDGRCAVVLPQGVLFRGNTEYEIRKNLIIDDRLEAVITVGNNIFYGTPIPVCILIFRSHKKHPGEILLIDGSTIYTQQRAQNIITNEDLERLYSLYKKHKNIDNFSKVATVDEIAANDYNLALNRYIVRTEEESITYSELKKEFLSAIRELQVKRAELHEVLSQEGYINE